MNQELYAFWKYDKFPYCLWGKIERFKGDLAYIKSYQGHFKPFMVCDEFIALKLIDQLNQLKIDKFSDELAFHKEYEERLDAIIAIPGINY